MQTGDINRVNTTECRHNSINWQVGLTSNDIRRCVSKGVPHMKPLSYLVCSYNVLREKIVFHILVVNAWSVAWSVLITTMPRVKVYIDGTKFIQFIPVKSPEPSRTLLEFLLVVQHRSEYVRNSSKSLPGFKLHSTFLSVLSFSSSVTKAI